MAQYLHIQAGPSTFTLTRRLQYNVRSAKLRSTGDASTTNHRGRARIAGTVEIEDDADALTALTAAAADTIFTIKTDSGTATATIVGLQVFDVDYNIGDGQDDGDVVVYRCGFEGNLVTSHTAGNAAAYA